MKYVLNQALSVEKIYFFYFMDLLMDTLPAGLKLQQSDDFIRQLAQEDPEDKERSEQYQGIPGE